MYHDVVRPNKFDESGFPGNASASYKLTIDQFEEHIKILKNKVMEPPILIKDSSDVHKSRLVLSFDDGGISAFDNILLRLDKLNWKAHFFITTDQIGKKGFLNRNQIRMIRKSGHMIGSHSCSHPDMTSLGRKFIYSEWRTSIQILSEIINEPVNTAAVPNGKYNRLVAKVAEEAGICFLFTSYPYLKVKYVGKCAVIGRYGVKDSSSLNTILKLARGDKRTWTLQKIIWDLKKLIQKLFGNQYILIRKFYFKIKKNDK